MPTPRQLAQGFLTMAQQAEQHIAKHFADMTVSDLNSAIEILTEQRRGERHQGSAYPPSSIPLAITLLSTYRNKTLAKKGPN